MSCDPRLFMRQYDGPETRCEVLNVGHKRTGERCLRSAHWSCRDTAVHFVCGNHYFAARYRTATYDPTVRDDDEDRARALRAREVLARAMTTPATATRRPKEKR